MRTLPLIGLISALGACLGPACKKPEAPYDHYCRLYREVEGKPMTSMLAVRLAQRAERELPSAFWKLLSKMHFPDSRYEALKTLAEEDGQAGWRCEAIEKRLQELKKKKPLPQPPVDEAVKKRFREQLFAPDQDTAN